MPAIVQPQPSIPATAIGDAVDALLDHGWAAFPALLRGAELDHARALLDGVIARGDVSGSWDVFGIGIHPLLPREPALAPWFAHPATVLTATALFGAAPRLVHTGARIVDPTVAAAGGRIGWHNHAFTDELKRLRPGDPRRGVRPTRLLAGWYLDGSDAASGPVLALPRRWDDPLAPPVEPTAAVWPGEHAVALPPGSLLVFTIDLWHTAQAGTGGFRRRLMGMHLQSRADGRAHPEDHHHDEAAIVAAETVCAEVGALLRA